MHFIRNNRKVLQLNINYHNQTTRVVKGTFSIVLPFFLFAIFILHSQESELYRYILDGTSALAWELSFSRCLSRLSST